MAYRVSTTPDGEQRWWQDGAVIPASHTGIRPARPDEAAVMDEIMRQDAAGRMPDPALGDLVRALMSA